jgi:hypothetical protein
MAVLQKCAEIMSEEMSWSLEKQRQEIELIIQKYPFNNRPEGLNDATRFVKETFGTF